jgi:hypothetical protein
MNILPVPYVSQLIQGGLLHSNDCGAAAALMILRAYGLRNNYTVDQLYDSIQPSGDVYLSASGISSAMLSAGLKSEWKSGVSINSLFGILVERKPLIALVHYGRLVDAGLTQRTGFRGAHFLVVNGMDITSVYIKDSYRDDGKESVEVPINIFLEAWTQCGLDGNPNGGAIVPTIPISNLPVPPPVVGVAYAFKSTTDAINVRAQPTASGAWVKAIARKDSPILYITKIAGIYNNWGFLSTGEGWICLDYFIKV